MKTPEFLAVTKTPIPPSSTEARWPVIVVTLLVTLLVVALPARYQAFSPWFPWLAYAVVIAPMVGVSLAPTSMTWHRIERWVVFGFCAFAEVMLVRIVGRLVEDMIVPKHGIGSVTLLESAAVIWVVNILVFSLAYWQLDRAGPAGRATGAFGAPDFLFGESEDAEESRPWSPRFLDYLFLTFATSTSFTPPDYARPASHRAKILVMLQATISLATLVLVASRAVATLS